MNRPIISVFWSQIDAEAPNTAYVQARYKAGRVVAQLAVSVEGKAGWISSLFVSESHRGKGLASLLLDRAFGICRDKGFESVGLNVHRKNETARRLYWKIGFVGFTEAYDDYQQFIKVLKR